MACGEGLEKRSGIITMYSHRERGMLSRESTLLLEEKLT